MEKTDTKENSSEDEEPTLRDVMEMMKEIVSNMNNKLENVARNLTERIEQELGHNSKTRKDLEKLLKERESVEVAAVEEINKQREAAERQYQMILKDFKAVENEVVQRATGRVMEIAAAEKGTAEERIAAERAAAEERIAAERAAAEKAAAAERDVAEKAAAAERAAAERAANERAIERIAAEYAAKAAEKANTEKTGPEYIVGISNVMPMPLYGSPNENIMEWVSKFRELKTMNRWTDKQAISAIPLSLHGAAEFWWKTYTTINKEWLFSSLDKILGDLITNLVPRTTSYQQWCKLNGLRQEPEERVRTYYWRILHQCNLYKSDMRDEEIKNYWLQGLLGPYRDILESDANKSIDKLLEKAELLENNAYKKKNVTVSTGPLVNAVNYNHDSVSGRVDKLEDKIEALYSLIIKRTTRCNSCGKLGHYYTDCKSRPQNSDRDRGRSQSRERRESREVSRSRDSYRSSSPGNRSSNMEKKNY